MKKKLLAGMATGLLVLGMAVLTHASSIYYTFETTRLIQNNNHDMLSEYLGLQYIFMVDRELGGTSTRYSGEMIYYQDDENSSGTTIETHDYFYVDMLLGNYISIDDAGYNTSPQDRAEINLGILFTRTDVDGTLRSASLRGGSSDNYTIIQQVRHNNLPLDWSIGSTWELYDGDRGEEDISVWSRFEVEMTEISEINPVAPVPEPSTILLVATGLLGLAGFRKKFKK